MGYMRSNNILEIIEPSTSFQPLHYGKDRAGDRSSMDLNLSPSVTDSVGRQALHASDLMKGCIYLIAHGMQECVAFAECGNNQTIRNKEGLLIGSGC